MIVKNFNIENNEFGELLLSTNNATRIDGTISHVLMG